MVEGLRKHELHSIQALRFIAALMVIICHSTFYALVRLDENSYFYGRGANGVVLFFAISGFVMIISSFSSGGVRVTWREFAEKRIIRIVPLYWIATTVKVGALFFAASFMLHATTDVMFIFKSYFFIPARNIDDRLEPLLGVGWTLNFEMAFYALFCLALLVRVNPIVFLSPILLLAAGASAFRSDVWPDPLEFYSNAIVINFLFGMVAAHLFIRGRLLPSYIAFIVTIAGLVFLFIPLQESGGSFSLFENPIVKGIFAFGVVYGCASLERARSISIPRWVTFLGAASYSLYLTHPLVAPAVPAVLNKLGLPFPYVSIALSIVVAIISGSMVYYWVERPVTRRLRPTRGTLRAKAYPLIDESGVK